MGERSVKSGLSTHESEQGHRKAEEGVLSSELFDQKMACPVWLWEDKREPGGGGVSPLGLMVSSHQSVLFTEAS